MSEVSARDPVHQAESPDYRIEEACDWFETDFRANRGPRIEDVLESFTAADRAAVLRELIALEVELRRGRGEHPTAKEYHDRFVSEPCLVDAAFAATSPKRATGRTGANTVRVDTGRNLLFGLLAFQQNFIDREALLAAFNAWGADRSRRLDQILLDQSAISPGRHMFIGELVNEHIQLHENDLQKSLASLSSTGSICDDLSCISDSDVQAGLSHVGAAFKSDGDDNETVYQKSDSERARFRKLRRFAEGGMGAIFVARDEELNREVALKEIHPRYADDRPIRTRFRMEAEVTGRLEHPGIVPVYSLGHHPDGRPYYAMRFIRDDIKGNRLKDAIQRFHSSPNPAPDALSELLRRFMAVCDAIAYAHSRGVLHRDLKPENILLGPYGETLVVDWGLAKMAGRPQGMARTAEGTLKPESAKTSGGTEAGKAVGTPAYMSPEQAEGRLEELGPATDVYSLGATLYSILTGQAPYEGKVEEVLLAVPRGDFRRPRTVKPEIPRPLEAVCIKAMARDPNERYVSPKALCDDIRHWLDDEPVLAFPDSFARRLARWTRRHRAATRVAVVGLIAMIASVSWPLFQALSNRRWAEENETAAEIILADTHEVFKDYEKEPERILERFPILKGAMRTVLVNPSLRLNDNFNLRKMVDELVKQAIKQAVKKYQDHDAKNIDALERTTLYNRILSRMLTDLGEIELKSGNASDALPNFEESVKCQARAVQIEQSHRPGIDDFLGFNKRNIDQYKNDLAEYSSRLVATLIRLDRFGDAEDRVVECLKVFRHSRNTQERFAAFLEERASEQQTDSNIARRTDRDRELRRLVEIARKPI